MELLTKQKVLRKLSFLILLCTLLSACATSNSRFPEYGETAKSMVEMPVIVDVVIAKDIEGRKLGYDADYVSKQIDIAVKQVTESLNERGFNVRLVKSLQGLSYDWTEFEWEVTENWKSTGEPYKGPELHNNNAWLTPSNKLYFESLFETAKGVGVKKTSDQSELEEAIFVENPAYRKFSSIALTDRALQEIDADYALFVSINGSVQKLSKTIATNVLVLAATQGWIGVSGLNSKAEVAIVKLADGEVLWHSSGKAMHSGAVKNSVRAAMLSHPFINDESIKSLRRKRVKELERKQQRRR